MRVATFAELWPELVERAHGMVWCAVATVDTRGRPTTRLLHPIWEDGRAWITTYRDSPKAAHLARTPHASLAYVADVVRPAYADCRAEWVDDPAERRRVWALFAATPPPLGFDPAPIYGSPDHPRFGLLRLVPWRVKLADTTAPDHYRVWVAG
jgi:hypothetical protein